MILSEGASTGGHHTLAACLPKVDKESEAQEMKQKQAHQAGYIQLPGGLSPGPRPAHHSAAAFCKFREATPDFLVKRPILLNFRDPRLVEMDSVEQ